MMAIWCASALPDKARRAKERPLNFSALSIRNPVPAILLFALLTLAAYNGHAAHYLWGA